MLMYEQNEMNARKMEWEKQSRTYVEKNEFKSKVKLNELIMYGAMWSLIADRWQSPNVRFNFTWLGYTKVKQLIKNQNKYLLKITILIRFSWENLAHWIGSAIQLEKFCCIW